MSFLEEIDTWLGNSTKTLISSQVKALKSYFHSHIQIDLQRAYILLLILVVWYWQPLDG